MSDSFIFSGFLCFHARLVVFAHGLQLPLVFLSLAPHFLQGRKTGAVKLSVSILVVLIRWVWKVLQRCFNSVAVRLFYQLDCLFVALAGLDIYASSVAGKAKALQGYTREVCLSGN